MRYEFQPMVNRREQAGGRIYPNFSVGDFCREERENPVEQRGGAAIIASAYCIGVPRLYQFRSAGWTSRGGVAIYSGYLSSPGRLSGFASGDVHDRVSGFEFYQRASALVDERGYVARFELSGDCRESDRLRARHLMGGDGDAGGALWIGGGRDRRGLEYVCRYAVQCSDGELAPRLLRRRCGMRTCDHDRCSVRSPFVATRICSRWPMAIFVSSLLRADPEVVASNRYLRS